MMLYPSMSSLLEKVKSRYLLVNLIAQRSRQISEESERNGITLDKKPVSQAIDEIAAGKVRAKIR